MEHEVSAHLDIYLERFPSESAEQAKERLDKIITLVCDTYSGLSAQIYEFRDLEKE